MYIINECVRWGKAGGRTPHRRQAEADKKVIHVWLTELRRYHNLLLVWLQMLLRIQITAPAPNPTCKTSSLPCPCLAVQSPFWVLLSIPSGGTGRVRGSSTSGPIQHHIPGLKISAYIKIQAWHGPLCVPSITPEMPQDPHFQGSGPTAEQST